MEINEQTLLQPLIIPSTTTTTAAAATASTSYSSDDTALFSDTRFTSRFVLIFFIAIISIWANYQASKGFEIIIINGLKDTPYGRKFNLFFVSNDKATRIVLSTSNLAEKILYPDDQQPKKPVTRVTIRLTNENLTRQAIRVEIDTLHEYVLHISSSLMAETNAEKAMMSAVQRGIARVWLWNGDDSAPETLIDGIVEYISIKAGLVASLDYRPDQLPVPDNISCWKHWNHIHMAHFLKYCETMKTGFIGRLNQAMQSSWHDRMVDDALGVPAQQLCGSYHHSSREMG